jgi:hypothetical protein
MQKFIKKSDNSFATLKTWEAPLGGRDGLFYAREIASGSYEVTNKLNLDHKQGILGFFVVM